MSDLRRGLMPKPTSRPSRPHPTPIIEEDGDSSSTSSLSSVGTIVPSENTRPVNAVSSPWHDCFDQELFIKEQTSSYHVYVTEPKDLSKDPLFVCHHGAGSGGLSFACLAKELRWRKPTAGILSIEARGHGSMSSDGGDSAVDYSISALTVDLVQMIKATQKKLGWKDLPNMILIGHSLGGAVVATVAAEGMLGAKLIGFAVIDVVEGSAMEALKSMQAILAGRPQSFSTVDEAIDWHVRSRTIRNHESARISVPSLLLEGESGRLYWRTDLAATQPFWPEWFKGLSSKFLSGKGAKLLLLAGTDRLDKDLMIGQMQGKFQMQVYPEAGHFVQEDIPEKVADVVMEFHRRNDRSALVLPPKVGDLLAQGKKV